MIFFGVPTGIRTPVIAVRGQRPRPLDDRDMATLIYEKKLFGKLKLKKDFYFYHFSYKLSYITSFMPNERIHHEVEKQGQKDV